MVNVTEEPDPIATDIAACDKKLLFVKMKEFYEQSHADIIATPKKLNSGNDLFKTTWLP